MDGVIIDSEPLNKKLEIELLEELGGKISKEEYMHFVGTTDQYMWSSFKEQFNLKISVDELVATKRKRFMDRIHDISLVENFKYILDTFADEEYLIALASSNNRKIIDKVISQFGLGEYLQAAMSGEDVTHGKPDPEIF